MFTEFSDHSEFGPLMTRMQVVDGQGDSKMDEEQWEAASESNVMYRRALADTASRYLHWIHLRKTIAISFGFCSFRFAFCFCCLLHPLLYILSPSHYQTPASLFRGIMTFCTHVWVVVLRHFVQLYGSGPQPGKLSSCSGDTGGKSMKNWAYGRGLHK